MLFKAMGLREVMLALGEGDALLIRLVCRGTCRFPLPP